MKIVLVGETEGDKLDLPMEIVGDYIILTIKGKDYQFNLKDFDDSEKFLKEKCVKGA